MRSLFIHDPADLDALIPGGVQLCSREFLEIVRAASGETALLPVTVTRSPLWRLRRKLALGSYLFYRPDEMRAALVREVNALRPTHIFLNRAELMRIAPLAAELAPEARIVIMSHGNQSGDDLYEAAGPGGRRNHGHSRFLAAWRLGSDLIAESSFRHGSVDAVCVMSEEESVLERWLGARQTIVLSRIIQPCPLDWKPVSGRVGFVGTLDHTPNRIALEHLCTRLQAMAVKGIELRLAGGPTEAGNALAERYPFVTYIGRPDDETLRREASTWSLFLNPIFWLSRGASMKLGQSLAWAVPALTTQAGARGYRLDPRQTFMTGDSPTEFAERLVSLVFDPKALEAVHANLTQSAPDWPDVNALASKLRSALG